jgi:hypothetical protein
MSEVTICIPAYRAEAFIERTLDFALGQTHRDIRVLVSVDAAGDRTADLCRARARTDPRLAVATHDDRLGWARNVNFLLDRVQTPLFFLYFHDDVIVPRYTSTLLAALEARPEAASVHCDVGLFGGSDEVKPGFEYGGETEERLAAFLVAPQRGSPLRSLARRELLDAGLRLPTEGIDGLWANEPFLFELVGRGPALRVPETLYFRWDKRSGGLTDGWQSLALEQVYASYRANVARFEAIIDQLVPAADARERLRFCLYLHQMRRVRALERQRGAAEPIAPERIHPGFVREPPPLEALGPRIRDWALASHATLIAAGA